MAVPALVQQSSVNDPPVGGTITMPGNFTAGNTAFLLIGSYKAAVSAVSFGGTAGVLDSHITFASGEQIDIWRGSNLAGGSASVSITYGSAEAGTYAQARVIEFSGLLTVSPIDANPAAAAGSDATPTSNSTGTLAQADELLISTVLHADQGSGYTTPSGWSTIISRDAWNSDESSAAAYKIVSATTSQTAVWGRTAGAWLVGVISYKAAAGGGGGGGSPPPRRPATVRVEQLPEERVQRRPFVQPPAAAPAPDSPPVRFPRARIEPAPPEERVQRRTLAVPFMLPVDVPPLGVWVPLEEPVPEFRAPQRRPFPWAAIAQPPAVSCTVAALQDGLVGAATVTQASTDMTVAGAQAGLTASATMAESIPCAIAGVQAGLTCAAVMSEAYPPFTVDALQPGLVAAAAMNSGVAPVDLTVAAVQDGLTAAGALSEAYPPFTVAALQDGLVAAATVTSASPVSMTVAAQQPGLIASGSISGPSVPSSGDARRRGRSRYRPQDV